MITLELPTAPPSLNQWQRMHWAKRKLIAGGMRDEIGLCLVVEHRELARVEIGSNGLGVVVLKSRAKGHRRVKITRRGSRTLDHDNLVGGCKPLVDALVKVGLIENDTPALVTVEYAQERGAGCRVDVWA